MHNQFLSNLTSLPQAGDPDAAERGLQSWRGECAELADRARRPGLAALADGEPGRRVLVALFGNSPYLSGCALNDPEWLGEILTAGPDTAFERLIAALDQRPSGVPEDDAGIATNLRIARRRASLLIALADIAGLWDGAHVTAALARFAECAIEAAVAHLLGQARANGDLEAADALGAPGDSGLLVLGMGKLGGGELNYSSDIDLIILYDQDKVRYRGQRPVGDFFVRLTRRLVALLEERTGDGYVFRTDLRLRPDPGATPVALSVLAAETYYESLGQNWERAAFIKARPIAGDRAAGHVFLAAIEPFVWRKSLDFATIEDIHAIKRQIQALRGGVDIRVHGHDIKLGRGGIREIEFFVQTQQLIWGGRYRDLRARSTAQALRALSSRNLVSGPIADEMTEAYWFLRRVEHRLQMIDDRQTHSLPATDDGLARLAVFLGYDAPEPFVTVLTDHLARVADHYSGLFSEETGGDRSITGAEPGNLVFTGVEDDPDTLRTLKGMGFTRPEAVSAMVRRWHRGRLRATRSTRAQQILTGLMPDLLKAFAGTANPDGALLKFNEFLANLPAGVQLFSLFQAHPRLLDLVAEIMGTAPRLAAYLSRRAHLLDAVLGEGFFGPLPDRAALAAGLRGELDYGHDFQDILETAWRWSGDAKFQVSVQQLQGLIDAESASPRLTDIADILVETILEAVWDELAQRSGRVPNAAFAVLGYGKLGSRSLTRGSDLDLVFVYQIEDPDSTSDGPRALAPQTYFTRLCQRLITAITAQTSEGQLYEVDIRLRPMGENGPLVSEVAAFERYYAEDAWTWELMALTRARVVVAPTELRRRLETLFRGALGRRRDPDRLVRDVAHMRRRIQAEHGTDQPWNIKHVRGGLIDIEFIAQYLQLREAACHPEVLDPNTARVLEKLSAAGALTMNQAEILIDAARVYHDVQAMMRLSLSGPLDETAAPEGLRQVMARAGGAVDFADLKTKLVDSQQVVLACFEEIIERPAAAVPDQPASEDASNPHGQGN